MKKILSASFVILFYITAIFGQPTDNAKLRVLENKVQAIEKENDQLKEMVRDRNKVYDEQVTALQNERTRILDFFESNLNFVKWVIAIFSAIGFGFLSFMGIRNRNDLIKWEKDQHELLQVNIEKGIIDKLASLTETDRDTIRQLVLNEKMNCLIKEKIRILAIWSSTVSSIDQFIKRILVSSFSEANIRFVCVDNLQETIRSFKPDIIFIDNTNNSFNFEDMANPKVIDEIIRDETLNSLSKGVFYYTNRSQKFNARNFQLFHFANTPATLQTNLFGLAKLLIDVNPSIKIRR